MISKNEQRLAKTRQKNRIRRERKRLFTQKRMTVLVDLEVSNANLRKKNDALFQKLAKYGVVFREENALPATIVQQRPNIACGEGNTVFAAGVQHTSNVTCASPSDCLLDMRHSQPQLNLGYKAYTTIGTDVGHSTMHSRPLRNKVAPIIRPTS
mmetsp:Transcript_290/g.323  ORF Transcript_290/g.323 Transcript_290/m.323 type:complete len:154 (-) Transcript_290:12-473(-)